MSADNSVEDVSSVPNAPVYEWHSGTDVLIPVDAIDSTMARYCEAGVPVTFDESLRTRPPLGGGDRPTRRTQVPRRPLRRDRSDHDLLTPTTPSPTPTESRAHHEHRNTILTLDDHGMCPHCRAPRGSSFNRQTCGGPSVRYRATTNSSPSRGKNPENEGGIYTIIDNNRGVRGPANIAGDRLRNRRSDSPIPRRPRRWKIGSQPPAIAIGIDAHRRGTTAREPVECRRRAAMTMKSPYLSCNGCGNHHRGERKPLH